MLSPSANEDDRYRVRITPRWTRSTRCGGRDVGVAQENLMNRSLRFSLLPFPAPSEASEENVVAENGCGVFW